MIISLTGTLQSQVEQLSRKKLLFSYIQISPCLSTQMYSVFSIVATSFSSGVTAKARVVMAASGGFLLNNSQQKFFIPDFFISFYHPQLLGLGIMQETSILENTFQLDYRVVIAYDFLNIEFWLALLFHFMLFSVSPTPFLFKSYDPSILPLTFPFHIFYCPIISRDLALSISPFQLHELYKLSKPNTNI